jgi:hypothetical protein
MGKMRLLVVVAFVAVLFSCKNTSDKPVKDEKVAENAIQQQQDGTIALDLKKADTYHDMENPESNTAEWSVIISKSGRYDVWLASATKDTTRLKYNSSVLLNVQDNTIEARPSIDKVIHNSVDVSYPYFKAESFLGSLYIQDTGQLNIQVISDKILPNEQNVSNDSLEDTRLLSIYFTPAD